jgi:DNA repair exonuclease SbcCD nuclease subunit
MFINMSNMSKITFLAIGDPHFKVSNIPDVEIFLSELKKLLEKEKFDFIVNLGDLLDTHRKLDTEPLIKAKEFFELLSSHAPLFSLVGNHDMINNSQFLTNKNWLHTFKNSKLNMTIVEDVVIRNIKGKNFIFMPYVSDGRFNEALQTSEETMKLINENNVVCIFAHQLFSNVKMGAITSSEVEDWKYPIPIISGHIHEKQKIKTDESYIYYTGSSMQHAFGESSDKTLAKISVNDDNSLSIEEIKLDLPIRKIKKLILSKIDKYISKNIDIIRSGRLKLRINIICSPDEFKNYRKSKEHSTYTTLGIKFELSSVIDKNDDKKEDKEIVKIMKNKKEESINFFSLLEQYISNNEYIKELYSEIKDQLKPNVSVEIIDDENE